jgi:hypothetical protein
MVLVAGACAFVLGRVRVVLHSISPAFRVGQTSVVTTMHSSLWAHRTTAGVKFADVALPDAQRNRSPDGSSMRTTRASPRESEN